MKPLNDLFDLVKQSDVTLIGYTTQDEKIKDELISNFNYIDVGQIDSSFSFKSLLRDLKLQSILETGVKKPDYILLDIGNINISQIPTMNNTLNKLKSRFYNRSKFIQTFIEDFKSQIYTDCSVFTAKPQFKIILTSSIYKSNIGDTNNFSGGSTPLYVSDLVFTISASKIKVIKNRFGMDGDEILYNTKQII